MNLSDFYACAVADYRARHQRRAARSFDILPEGVHTGLRRAVGINLWSLYGGHRLHQTVNQTAHQSMDEWIDSELIVVN